MVGFQELAAIGSTDSRAGSLSCWLLCTTGYKWLCTHPWVQLWVPDLLFLEPGFTAHSLGMELVWIMNSPRTKARSFACQSHCMGTWKSWYSHCLQFLKGCVDGYTGDLVVMEHFFSDPNACFLATLPLMKMSRLCPLQQWQEKQEMPSPIRALLLKFHQKQLCPRLASL